MKASERVAKNLRNVRKRLKISQERAAELSGMSLRYYAMLESKKPRSTRVDTLQRIADGLKVPLEKLLK